MPRRNRNCRGPAASERAKDVEGNQALRQGNACYCRELRDLDIRYIRFDSAMVLRAVALRLNRHSSHETTFKGDRVLLADRLDVHGEDKHRTSCHRFRFPLLIFS